VLARSLQNICGNQIFLKVLITLSYKNQIIEVSNGIAAAYARELREAKTFDFYRDPKTGDIFIRGNQSNNMVKIDISRFLK
jgi:hypothetical protein